MRAARDQGALPAAQYHADGVPLRVELNGIDELANQEEAAPVCLVELLRTNWLGYSGGIDPGSFVGDIDADDVRPQLGPNVHPLVAIFAVTSHDGVADCLGEHDAEAKPDALGGRGIIKKKKDDQLKPLLAA